MSLVGGGGLSEGGSSPSNQNMLLKCNILSHFWPFETMFFSGGYIQGVPKKTQFNGTLAITPLWKGLEIKEGGVSKISGNFLSDRHQHFSI